MCGLFAVWEMGFEWFGVKRYGYAGWDCWIAECW